MISNVCRNRYTVGVIISLGRRCHALAVIDTLSANSGGLDASSMHCATAARPLLKRGRPLHLAQCAGVLDSDPDSRMQLGRPRGLPTCWPRAVGNSLAWKRGFGCSRKALWRHREGLALSSGASGSQSSCQLLAPPTGFPAVVNRPALNLPVNGLNTLTSSLRSYPSLRKEGRRLRPGVREHRPRPWSLDRSRDEVYQCRQLVTLNTAC